jgi:hypothetical protein
MLKMKELLKLLLIISLKNESKFKKEDLGQGQNNPLALGLNQRLPP